MTRWTIKQILAGSLEMGAPVVIEGWLRTRRDSKAGPLVPSGPRRFVLRADPDRRRGIAAQLSV